MTLFYMCFFSIYPFFFFYIISFLYTLLIIYIFSYFFYIYIYKSVLAKNTILNWLFKLINLGKRGMVNKKKKDTANREEKYSQQKKRFK